MGLPVQPVDEQTLRSCYRKLALCVHPDKSDDPRAEQAFKILTKVYCSVMDAQLLLLIF